MPNMKRQTRPVKIHDLSSDDVQKWVDAQAELRGLDEVRRLSALWHDMQDGKRHIIAAWDDDRFLGHITLLWQSRYPPFGKYAIPEIVDLWVAPEMRGLGIGAALLNEAEHIAAAKGCVRIGLGVGSVDQFAAAHGLYTTRGYAPDGAGPLVQEAHDVTMWIKDLATT